MQQGNGFDKISELFRLEGTWQGRVTWSRGTGTRPGGFGMSAEMQNPPPPWAAVAVLCHPWRKEVLHGEVELVVLQFMGVVSIPVAEHH